MHKKCHFIGIGGIGMSGLAKMMLSQQCQVSGSDISQNYVTEGLLQLGAKVFIGHDASYIQSDTTVIYSTDIKQDNPEFVAAQELNCVLLHRSELLKQLMNQQKVLAVAGTHGKTTTSALLTTVFLEGGLDPSYAVGGMIPQLQSNAGYGKGTFFIAEADESDGTFLNYHPFGAILTNIDTDHMNFFLSEKNLNQAFETFIQQVQSEQHLFWCKDNERLSKLNPKGISYGFQEDCQLRAVNIRQSGWKSVFDIVYNGQTYASVEISLIGNHNVLNALAVFGLALSLGVAEASLRKSFSNFGGVLRRCEKKWESHGIIFLDDYAHHPTEIQTTLRGIRKAIGERRLVVIFQPHRYTRIRDCLGSFKNVFNDADEIIVTSIFAAGENPIPGISPDLIIEEIGNNSTHLARGSLAEELREILRPHDVVVSLGAGDITKLAFELLPVMNQKGIKKYKVGVVYGGRSHEHEISCLSAKHIREALRKEYYEVEPFHISKQGMWEIDKIGLQQEILTAGTIQKIQDCDILFPVLHGPFGEDGTLQGFFEMLNKPYVGCDYRSSAIAMDKALTKELALYHGVATSPYISCTFHEWKDRKAEFLKIINEKLQFPLFVKPTHLGSSIGVIKVDGLDPLEEAINQAFLYDSKIVIEKGIEGREIEFAVLGNDQLIAFPPGEICSAGKLYDYEAKYGSYGMETCMEAKLSLEKVNEGIELAKKVFKMIGGTGLARIDFFLDQEEKYWLNEVNPLPGFTEVSLYPQMCARHGLKSEDLIDQLIILGLQRKRFLKKYETIL